MYCIDVAAEVAQAEESARVLDLIGRGLEVMSPDEAEDFAFAAIERACIVDERAEAGAAGVGVAGLVSVPTSGKTASASVARDSEALRKALRATEIDKRKSRVSKLRRAVGFSARAIGAALDRPGFRDAYVAMLTLTYERAEDWNARHVSDLLQHVRKHLKARGHKLHYVWVAELQKRGALHYHVAVWLPPGVMLPKADEHGWWPHGSTNIKQARKAVPYLLKYMSKGLDVSGFPKGARVHGSGGLEHCLRRARRWLGLPAFVKARADCFDDWRRAPGGGWSDPDGNVIPSEYERAWVGDRWSCRQVVDYGRPFDAAGPFSWLHRSPFAEVA